MSFYDSPPWETPAARNDTQNAALARQLDEKYRGRWMVLWSWWSQTFLAWPTWVGATGGSLEKADPKELEDLMIAQEGTPRNSSIVKQFPGKSADL